MQATTGRVVPASLTQRVPVFPALPPPLNPPTPTHPLPHTEPHPLCHHHPQGGGPEGHVEWCGSHDAAQRHKPDVPLLGQTQHGQVCRATACLRSVVCCAVLCHLNAVRGHNYAPQLLVFWVLSKYSHTCRRLSYPHPPSARRFLWGKHEGDHKQLTPMQSMLSGFSAAFLGPIATGGCGSHHLHRQQEGSR